MPYCGLCGEPFKSQRLFERHRVGPYHPPGVRRCLTPEEMRAKGWEHNGRTWVDKTRPNPFAAKEAQQ